MGKHIAWKILMIDPDNTFSKVAGVAQKVILEEIYLLETKTWRKQGVIPPEVLTLKNKGYTELIYPREYKKRKDIYSTLCTFGVRAFTDKSPNKPIWEIEASFCTSFSYNLNDPDFKRVKDPEEDWEADLLIYLYEITPVSTAWPYWRELAQNMSSRMGFPALMVPSLKIVPGKNEISDEELALFD